MAILDIVLYPHPTLRARCEVVARIDDAILRLLDDMAETMYRANGVGLAAPQVDSTKRVIVIDADTNHDERGTQLLELINPRITSKLGKKLKREEGCLSFPDIFEAVERYEEVIVSALNRKGEPFEVKGTGLLSIALQHEIDHLDGVLFIDYLSSIKQGLIKRRLQKRIKPGQTYWELQR